MVLEAYACAPRTINRCLNHKALPAVFRRVLKSQFHAAFTGVPIFKLCQYAGEIVVIAPLTYHFTISHGFEIMESASIGLKEWIDKALFGKPQLPIEYAICKEIDFGEHVKIVCHLISPAKLGSIVLLFFL